MEFPKTIRASSSQCTVVKEEPCLTEQAIESKIKEQYTVNYLDHSEPCAKKEKMETMDFFEGLNNEDASNSNFEISLKRRASDSLVYNEAESDMVDTASVGAKMESPNPNELSDTAIKSNILSGVYKISNKIGRSGVWNVFGRIETGAGDQLEGIVACKTCRNIYKYNSKTTSNLVKHKCYVILKLQKENTESVAEVSLEEKHFFLNLITKWTVQNCRSFKIVEDSGLKEVSNFLISMGAKHGKKIDLEKLFPLPTTVSKNIEQLYLVHKFKVKEEIQEIKNEGFAVTCDLWTDNFLRISYLACTIHYIRNGQMYDKLLGLKSMEGEKPTAINVNRKVEKLLEDFDCALNERTIVVTNRESYMIAAFARQNNIFCANHLLHNCIEKSVQDVAEVSSLFKICRKLVKYFKKCGIDSDLSNTLKSFSPTRWNTLYYLLHSIQKNWIDITNKLKDRNELSRINNLNLNSITDLLKVLKQVENATKKLEGENYPTLHLAYIYFHKLKKVCIIDSQDRQIVKDFKERLLMYIESIGIQNLKLIHKIALFLFPPANKLTQFNDDEKNLIREECKQLMLQYKADSQRPVHQNKCSSELSADTSDLFDDFVSSPVTPSSENMITDELQMYENVNVKMTDNFNALEWWHVHQSEFKILHKVSCLILGTPATNAPSERILSKARSIITEKRSVISKNAITINQTMFLHCNVGIDLNIWE